MTPEKTLTHKYYVGFKQSLVDGSIAFEGGIQWDDDNYIEGVGDLLVGILDRVEKSFTSVGYTVASETATARKEAKAKALAMGSNGNELKDQLKASLGDLKFKPPLTPDNILLSDNVIRREDKDEADPSLKFPDRIRKGQK